MRGQTQLKRRHATANERRAIWSAFQTTAAKTFELKRVLREDLQTREVTESSRSKMNAETYFLFNYFCPLKNRAHVLPQSLLWEQLERGAVFFSDKAKFWIENNRPVPAAETVEESEFYRSGEIDLHYVNILTAA